MCTLINNFKKSKTFTGYKVVIVTSRGNYRSPATGILYKEGLVKIPSFTSRSKRASMHADVASANSPFYNYNFRGFTAVFVKYANALALYREFEMFSHKRFAILEMTISNDLKRGDYNRFPVIAGRHIDNLKIHE